MSKKICVIYTATNGLHLTNDNVSKKSLYGIARLISLTYSIGNIVDNKYNEEKRVTKIVKPKSIHFDSFAQSIHKISFEQAENEGSESDQILNELKIDLKKVDVIISHNLDFHLKAVIGECFRACVNIDFTKFILIDTISFQHNFEFPKLLDLAKKLKIKKSSDNIVLITNIFINLYAKYQDRISNQ